MMSTTQQILVLASSTASALDEQLQLVRCPTPPEQPLPDACPALEASTASPHRRAPANRSAAGRALRWLPRAHASRQRGTLAAPLFSPLKTSRAGPRPAAPAGPGFSSLTASPALSFTRRSSSPILHCSSLSCHECKPALPWPCPSCLRCCGLPDQPWSMEWQGVVSRGTR